LILFVRPTGLFTDASGAGRHMSGYVEGILIILAINVVFAYGAFLPLAAGQLNLGLAGFAAIGAYSSAYVGNVYEIPAAVAIPFGAFAAGFIALIVAVPVLRTRGIYLALATFALGQIVQATILNLGFVGGAAGYPVTEFIRLPFIAIFTVAVVALVSLLFGTRFGIAVTACTTTSVLRISWASTRAFQITAFVLGSAIAGIAGGLYAHHFSYIEAQYFNVSLSITIVLYAALGGTQTVIGPLLGAAMFTLLPELLRGSAHWRYVVFAAGLIVLMALRPEGLLTGDQLRRLLGWHRNGDEGERRRVPREGGHDGTAAHSSV
jgi:branched-chain amino acid transport system permease protein